MKRCIMVIGWSKHHRQMDTNPDIIDSARGPHDYETGYAVYKINPDGSKTYLSVDCDQFITLKQSADILAQAEELTGNNYSKVVIEDESYTEDGQTINRKHYVYSRRHNRLTIWEGKRDLAPIYENLDGKICKDRDALADCLM